MWVICAACHRALEMKVPKGKRLWCKECGSRAVLTVRVIKTSMLNGGQMPPDVAKTITHAGLLSIANHRGYKPGWAAMKFREIFRVWPPRGQDPAPDNPSGELMKWIKAQNKAYAKAMGEKEGRAPGERRPRSTTPKAHKYNPTGNAEEETLMSSEDYEVDL